VNNNRCENKVVVLEVHPGDYHHVERAAERLGYGTPEFVMLSASLVASAIANGDDALRTPAALRESTDRWSR